MSDGVNNEATSVEAKQVEGEGWLGVQIEEINLKLADIKHEAKVIENEVGADSNDIHQIKHDVETVKQEVQLMMRALTKMNDKLDKIIGFTKPPAPRPPVKFKVTTE